MRGRLAEISIVGLLKMFHEGRQSGKLLLESSDGRADIFFHDGDIVRCDIAGPVSADGAYDIFGWRDGTFEFDLAAEIPPPSPVAATGEFIERGAEREQRWFPCLREGITASTVVRRERLPQAAGDDVIAFLEAAGDGRPVIGIAQRLGIGLLAAAERTVELKIAKAVVLLPAAALKLAAGVQDTLNGLLWEYAFFAGKTLAVDLAARAADFARGIGLDVSGERDKLRVAASSADEDAVQAAVLTIRYVLRAMAGPLGEEATLRLWDKAWGSLEPASRALAEKYQLTRAIKEVGGDDG